MDPERCPACGSPAAPGVDTCPGCGLDVALFGPVRSAAVSRTGTPSDPVLLREILLAVGAEAEQADPIQGPGALASPARFPATPVTRTVPPPRPSVSGTAGPIGFPPLPVLEPGEPLEVLRRQVEALTTLARRLEVEPADRPDHGVATLLAGSIEALEGLRRELFVRNAAALGERIEIALGRSNELAPLLSTSTPEAELEAARGALARGDLPGSYRPLRRAEDALDALEEEWATAQLLSLEAELLGETIRELGGDPGPALGPLTAARAKARGGDRVGAEPLLSHSVLALWHLAAPLLLARIAAYQGTLAGAAGTGAAARARAALHAMTRELHARNFGAAVMAFRRARDAVAELAESPTPPAAVGG